MKEREKWEIDKKLSPKLRKIAEALNELGATLPCPRCGTTEFGIAKDYVVHQFSRDLNSVSNESILTVVTVCVKCGFVSQHELEKLQPSPKEDKKETQE